MCIRDSYKDNAETIMGNMDSIVFLGGRESSTIKEISENWLGKATIYMQTESRTRGPVSYTHLDVYKRQSVRKSSPVKRRRP